MRQIQLMMFAILLHQLTGSPLHASDFKEGHKKGYQKGYQKGYTNCYKKIQSNFTPAYQQGYTDCYKERQQLNQRKSEVQERKDALVILAALGSGTLVNCAISSCTGDAVFAGACGFIAGVAVARGILVYQNNIFEHATNKRQ